MMGLFQSFLRFMISIPNNIIRFWALGIMAIFAGGYCFVKFCHLKVSMELLFISGCISIISLSHLIASIGELCGMSFQTYRNLFLIIYIIILSGSYTYLHRNGRIGSLNSFVTERINRIRCWTILEKGMLMVILLVIGYIMLNSMTRGFYGSSDDGYYITKVGMMIQDNSLHITNSQAANGIIESAAFIRADASTWCALLALISSAFGISYTVTAHVAVVPFVLTGIVSVISLLAKKMFQRTTDKMLYWIIFFLFALTAPYMGTMTEDYWIFTYTWYGIPTMYIMIYFLIYCMIEIWTEEKYRENIGMWILMTLAVATAIAAEVVAVFVIPCMLLMFGLPYIILNRRKLSLRFIENMGIVLIPIVAAVISVLLQYHNMQDMSLNAGVNGGFNMNMSSLDAWKVHQFDIWKFSPVNIYTAATVLSLFLIKNKRIKAIFGWSFLVALFTFLNPFFYRFMCVHVSTEMVYYRLYWCVPNLLIISYFVVELITRLSRNKLDVILICSLLSIYMLGSHDVVYEKFSTAENLEKLDPQIVSVAKDLLNLRSNRRDIYAVLPEDLCNFVRQYSLQIIYPVGVRSPDSVIVVGSGVSYLKLYNRLYGLDGSDPGKFTDNLSIEDVHALQTLGTEVVVYHENAPIPEALQNYDKMNRDGCVFVKIN